jgi:LuxR family maltose regulon positive regulatory protein
MRREWLAAGACAAWLSLDGDDDGARFVEALLLSTYTALGRPAPARVVEQTLRSGVDPLEAIAGLLGELAEAARPTALVLDDVHAMPQAAASELLAYLALNLPPNVHLILGTRRRLPFTTSDLLAHGQFVPFDVTDLSFRLDETRALLHARCGERVDADTVARVHERVEGWPMGLQLLLVDVEKEADRVNALRRVAATGGSSTRCCRRDPARLDREDVEFLTAISPLEQFQATLRGDHRAARLRRTARAPSQRHAAVNAVEGSEWLRLHATCREALLRRWMRSRKRTGWRCIGEPRNGYTAPECWNAQRITRSPRKGTRRLMLDRSGALRVADIGPRRPRAGMAGAPARVDRPRQ